MAWICPWTGTGTSAAGSITVTGATWDVTQAWTRNFITMSTAASSMSVAISGMADAFIMINTAFQAVIPRYTAPQMTERALAEHRELAERDARARERARELLLSVLSPEQGRDYRERGWFELRGSAGGRWRIRNEGQAGNVDELDAGGKRLATWCCHPPGGLPSADAHLSQLLQLETDEPGFRATGNRTPRERLTQAA